MEGERRSRGAVTEIRNGLVWDPSTPRVPNSTGAAVVPNRRSRYHPSPAVSVVAPAPMRLDGTPTIRTSRCPGSSTAVPETNGARKKGPQYATGIAAATVTAVSCSGERRQSNQSATDESIVVIPKETTP